MSDKREICNEIYYLKLEKFIEYKFFFRYKNMDEIKIKSNCVLIL